MTEQALVIFIFIACATATIGWAMYSSVIGTSTTQSILSVIYKKYGVRGVGGSRYTINSGIAVFHGLVFTKSQSSTIVEIKIASEPNNTVIKIVNDLNFPFSEAANEFLKNGKIGEKGKFVVAIIRADPEAYHESKYVLIDYTPL